MRERKDAYKRLDELFYEGSTNDYSVDYVGDEEEETFLEVEEGTWVTGYDTRYGGYRGYVQYIGRDDRAVVRIIEDGERGFISQEECHLVKTRVNLLKPLPISLHEEGYIRNLIDISLQENNMTEFMILTERLKATQSYARNY